MSGGPREWPVPVVTWADRKPLYVTVTVIDGEVVTKAPAVPYVMSPTSKELLAEAYIEAFSLAQAMDQGLT